MCTGRVQIVYTGAVAVCVQVQLKCVSMCMQGMCTGEGAVFCSGAGEVCVQLQMHCAYRYR